ncbi:DEAD-box family RNA helicase [Theileria orientalis strain Shintoku]|uniref:DEAD-box family RNA helicase n=1 Tax=Theileria orientalis strain Shintoku TaxID=869250 RepID=J4CCH7_THEOR|nr:DEAD-box family RNA helicase [Theileria orientalis strain Shintoku]BAM39412.1 DEAD-box family RNA helicase [Theileria orientalis strain Shintoku]|eukprot:XP_009689713.1 DEAD-box family RNA helicase [Theileria orientalis strain Shintoku]
MHICVARELRVLSTFGTRTKPIDTLYDGTRCVPYVPTDGLVAYESKFSSILPFRNSSLSDQKAKHDPSVPFLPTLPVLIEIIDRVYQLPVYELYYVGREVIVHD